MGRRWLGADIVAGGSTTIKADKLPTEPDYDAAYEFAILMKAWDNAGDIAKKRFRAFLATAEQSAEPYDALDDFAKGNEVAFAHIRDRMANGGPGWEPRAAPARRRVRLLRQPRPHRHPLAAQDATR
jgi:hypothetical protein